MSDWYYRVGKEEAGPVPAPALRRMVLRGIVTKGTYVRRGESGQWVKASKVKGLGQALSDAADFEPEPLSDQVDAIRRSTVSDWDEIVGEAETRGAIREEEEDWRHREERLKREEEQSRRQIWYCQYKGESHGPFSPEYILEGVESGKIPSDIPVRKDNGEWQPADRVLDLLPEHLRSKLASCPDCGKDVSRAAESCPHCGRPLQAERKPATSSETGASVFGGPSPPAAHAPHDPDEEPAGGSGAIIAVIGVVVAISLALGILSSSGRVSHPPKSEAYLDGHEFGQDHGLNDRNNGFGYDPIKLVEKLDEYERGTDEYGDFLEGVKDGYHIGYEGQ